MRMRERNKETEIMTQRGKNEKARERELKNKGDNGRGKFRENDRIVEKIKQTMAIKR